MSKPKPAPLPAGTVVGGYQIIKKLAAGGFGVVYLAEDEQRHLIALKEYLPSSLAERSPGELTPRVKPEKQPLYRLGLKSFFEEGRSLAQISHPSVVSVLNFFRENETVYMVMNYLQGDTLQDFIVTARDLKRDKVFRESTIRSLFDEILRGLRIVHQHKMLHLDIKPASIFITNDNKAVLLDFGAARKVLSKEGNFIRPMYTPGFAAPEMYRRDGTLGPWTDIYAIGACIYACMQGYPPNDAPQRIEKDRLALSLSRLRNVYSDNLIEVTEWCMTLDPLSRPQSVFALQKELARETERRYTPLRFLHEAIIAGHHQLLRYATQKALIDTPRTTVVACVLQGNAAYWAHCGDSRLYMVRGDKLIARTRDHSYSELQETLSQVVPMGERFNRNVLFTCLGSPGKPVVDAVGPLLMQSGDRILLCSDGLWGNVSYAEVTEALATRPISDAVPELVEQALRKGGPKCDNVTVICVEWESAEDNDSLSGISTQSLGEEVFASTIQASVLGQEPADELDEAEIERSIKEINEAIRRSSQKKS